MSRWREIALFLMIAGTLVTALALWQRNNIGLLSRWRFLVAVPILGGFILAGALAVYVSSKQASIWIHPQRNADIGTPESAGIEQWEAVELQTADGLRLTGWFIPAQNGDGATIIHMHGLSGNRSSDVPLAAILAEAGYNNLLFDLRNHGESAGDVTTLGYSEIEDARAALNYVLTRSDVDAEKIAIHGSSLGALVAIRAAAHMPEIKAVISESGFASVDSGRDQIVAALTGMPPGPLVNWFLDQQTGVPVSSVSPITDLAQVAPRPVLFVHGEDDPVVNVSHSQRMYDAASEPKSLCIIANAGHGGFLTTDPDRYKSCILQFLDAALRG